MTDTWKMSFELFEITQIKMLKEEKYISEQKRKITELQWFRVYSEILNFDTKFVSSIQQWWIRRCIYLFDYLFIHL